MWPAQGNHRLHSLSVCERYRHPLAAHPTRVAKAGGASPAGAERSRSAESSESTARDRRVARVEAVLFLASEPLNATKIGRFASLADATEARTLIRRLNQFYDQSSGAFRVEEIAGGYQLRTRRTFGGWLHRLHHVPLETRLSSPALETLAVVAYRQPITRGGVEAIRGVQCGEMLRQLMERDLLKIVARSDELGRPYLYGTTKRFLQLFGLRDLDDLPRAVQLRTALTEIPILNEPTGLGRPDETLSVRNLQEEQPVTIGIPPESALDEVEEELEMLRRGELVAEEDEEEEFEDDDDDDADDDEEDDEEDEDLDDDFDDEDWEEVGEDDEEWEEEDDEDEEWDDDDEEEDDEEEEWEEEAE
ncbi:MAG TPA: SMC-Scp complex subunit ScpB [Pirellulales bacterium]|nr:SMC-Scp complex subunit ScpB [Pirellulales bacterium]